MGVTKAQQVMNQIAEIFKTFAMEGAGAQDPDVQTFSGRIYKITKGNTGYSAMIKIAARFSQLLSTNSGCNMISFKIKYEGYELHEDFNTNGNVSRYQLIGPTISQKLREK